MKQFIATILAVVVLMTVPALVLIPTGCGTPTAKVTQVAGSVSFTVDAAMKSWGSWVRQGKATEEQRIKVRDAYQKYDAAMLTAEKVAKTTITQPDGQAAYVTALNVASQSSVELIALIEAFTKK